MIFNQPLMYTTEHSVGCIGMSLVHLKNCVPFIEIQTSKNLIKICHRDLFDIYLSYIVIVNTLIINIGISPIDTGAGTLYTSDADGIVFSVSLEQHLVGSLLHNYMYNQSIDHIE